MQRDMATAVERAQEENRRSRYLGEVAGSIDLDEVVRRTLDAAGAIPGVDAAAITVLGPEGDFVTTQIGLGADEAQEYAPPVSLPGRHARSMTIQYEEAIAPAEAEGRVARVLAVPIRTEVEPVGVLALYSRTNGAALTEDQLRELEDLAARAGPAIDNARRFREARQLADLDALTGLHNRRYFHETLAREVSRAQRYNRRLALLALDLDNLKLINDRLGHLAGDGVLAEVANRIRDVVRSADIACRIGGDEFAVILPESSLEDANQLYLRLQSHVGARPVAQGGLLSFSGGVAELRQRDDAVTFFQRADEALYQAKDAGKGQAMQAPVEDGDHVDRPDHEQQLG
jgi:diguanylate cyclase (GGDEF)-like protein